MTRPRRPTSTARGTGASSPRRARRSTTVSQAVGFDFASLPDAEEVDTIGGLVTAAVGRVPSRGEILKGPGPFEFEVLDADPRRVKRVKISPLAAGAMTAPTAAEAKPDEPGGDGA